MSSAQERITSRVCPQCERVLEGSLFSCPYCGRDLTGRKKKLEIAFEIPAHSKARLTFAVFWSADFIILLGSFWLAVFYPSSTLYWWLLIPAISNFFVGYLVREVDTATKIIIVSFLIHLGVIIGLLNVPLFNDALYMHASPIRFAFEKRILEYPETANISAVVIYYVLNIPAGICVALLGITVRHYIRSILEI